MANKLIICEQEDFLDCFEVLVTNDKSQKSCAKVVKELKPAIVEYLKKNNSTCFENECGKIEIKQAVSQTFDEDKLLDWLQKNHPEFIVNIPTIDMDALNEYMYEHMEEAAQLIPFKQEKIMEKVYIHAN